MFQLNRRLFRIIPLSGQAFICNINNFAVITKDNIVITANRNSILISTANDNTVCSACSDFVMSTFLIHYRFNRGCTTDNAISLLLKFLCFWILGYFGTNKFASLYVIFINFFITQIRNDFTLSILILDITLIAECNHATTNINNIFAVTTNDNHAILIYSILAQIQFRIRSINVVISFFGINDKQTISFILIAVDINSIVALARIHNSKGLETVITIMSLVNIDIIYTRAKIVLAEFKVIGNNLTLKFTMSKLSRLFINNTILRERTKSTIGILIRILIIHKDSIRIISFRSKEIILRAREHHIDFISIKAFNNLI